MNYVHLHIYVHKGTKGGIMRIHARLEGIRTDDNRVFQWHLIFTPATLEGRFALSNRWVVSVDRVSGEIVFDRNGLYVHTNVESVDTSIISDRERAIFSIFFDLLRMYPENEYVTVSMDLDLDDDEICTYLLDTVITVNMETFSIRS